MKSKNIFVLAFASLLTVLLLSCGSDTKKDSGASSSSSSGTSQSKTTPEVTVSVSATVSPLAVDPQTQTADQSQNQFVPPFFRPIRGGDEFAAPGASPNPVASATSVPSLRPVPSSRPSGFPSSLPSNIPFPGVSGTPRPVPSNAPSSVPTRTPGPAPSLSPIEYQRVGACDQVPLDGGSHFICIEGYVNKNSSLPELRERLKKDCERTSERDRTTRGQFLDQCVKNPLPMGICEVGNRGTDQMISETYLYLSEQIPNSNMAEFICLNMKGTYHPVGQGE